MLNRIYKKLELFINRQVVFNKLKKHIHSLSFFIKRNKKYVSKNSKLLFSLFIAFAISDLLLIKSYKFLIPEKELAPLSIRYSDQGDAFSSDEYKIVWENNIFHTGPIPSDLKMNTQPAEPVLSSLPFTLKGTIIHANPSRSVATVKAGSEDKTFSYQAGDIIENHVEVRKIERAKLIFFNQNNSRLEYIVIPEEKTKLNISYQTDRKKPKLSQDKSLIIRKGNSFAVKRSDLNDYLGRLPEILNQARVVPHTQDGELKGFRFAFIDKGSIFENLGFEKGDIIKEVAGELVTTPEQALELFERLKGGSGFKMLVEKDGQDVELEYNVNENAPIR